MGRCQGRMCGATLARLCRRHRRGRLRRAARPGEAGAGRGADAGTAGGGGGRPDLSPRPPTTPAPARAGRRRRRLTATSWSSAAASLGLSTALYLAREGADVLVVERGEAGMAASTANAGSLHVQLLPYDFDGDAATAARRSTACRSARAASRCGGRSRREAGEALGIRTEGGLMLAETAAELAWARAKVAVERASGHREPPARRQRAAHASRPISARISSAPPSARPRARSTRCAAPMRCAAWPRAAGARLREGVEVQAHRPRRRRLRRDDRRRRRSAPGGW